MPAPDRYCDLPGLVIAERTARRLGLPSTPGGMLLDTTREPTAAELAAAQATALSAQLRRGPAGWLGPVGLLVASPPHSDTSGNPMVYVLAVLSVLTTVLASGIAVWLAAAEMRDDLSTLTAVGAGPRLRRWTAAAQAGLIVGVGGILGVAGGIAPAAGLVALRDDLRGHITWWPLVLAWIHRRLVCEGRAGGERPGECCWCGVGGRKFGGEPGWRRSRAIQTGQGRA